MDILVSQIFTQIITILTLILSVLLAVVITGRYFKRKKANLLFWGIGIWLFTLGVFLEVLFTYAIYSELLIKLYLFVVSALVESLAVGSILLIKSKRIKSAYCVFVFLSTLFLVYTLVSLRIGNILLNNVVYGTPPSLVIIASSLITFPAAAILVIVAWKGYKQQKNKRLLSIILGVVIVSIAGTLYIAQFPAFLYLAEFIGVLFLWYGFI